MLMRYIQPNTRLTSPCCIVGFSLFCLGVYFVQSHAEMGASNLYRSEVPANKAVFHFSCLGFSKPRCLACREGGTSWRCMRWVWESAEYRAWELGSSWTLRADIRGSSCADPVAPVWLIQRSAVRYVPTGGSDPWSGREAGRQLAARCWGENRLVWDRASLRAVTVL